MASFCAVCPACHHSILNHKKGVCQVIVTVTRFAKGHCGCTHIKPTDAVQITFKNVPFVFDFDVLNDPKRFW